jgi:hypothetical protein
VAIEWINVNDGPPAHEGIYAVVLQTEYMRIWCKMHYSTIFGFCYVTDDQPPPGVVTHYSYIELPQQ